MEHIKHLIFNKKFLYIACAVVLVGLFLYGYFDGRQAILSIGTEPLN